MTRAKFGARRTPTIRLDRVAENEQRVASIVQHAISELERLCDEFEAAVYLCQDANELMERLITDKQSTEYRIYREWGDIAKRDAVMTLYHFGELINGLSHLQPNQAPNFISKIEISDIGKLYKEFNEIFPNIKDMRDMIAHRSEPYSKRRLWDKNSIRSNLENEYFNITDTCSNNNVSFSNKYEIGITRNGNFESLSISPTTLKNMNAIKLKVWNCFSEWYSDFLIDTVRVLKPVRFENDDYGN